LFDIQELYGYSFKVRRRFANKLLELPWEKVTENKEASFNNMRNILIHMIDNEDKLVNWDVPDRSAEYKRLKKPDEYTDMKQVIDHLDEVESKTKAYFASIAGKESQEYARRTHLVLGFSGKSFELSVEEVLFQSFTEQLYHLGELIALLWQDDIEPPPMGWFANNPRPSAT
jgi:uncharacterized damage-inducible protein DinB